MLEYLLVDYKKYIAQRKASQSKINFTDYPFILKLIIIIWIMSGLLFIVLFFLWILSSPNNYFLPYVVFSAFFFVGMFYSMIKSVDYMYHDKYHEMKDIYTTFGLNSIRGLLKKYNLYSKYKIEMLITQINDEIPVSQETVSFVKKVIDIGIAPLLIGLAIVFYERYNWTAVLIYSLTFICLIVVFVLILSPTWKILEKEDTKMLNDLKKDLQNLLITDFGN